MQTETNPDLRKKAYDAKIKGADLIAEDMIEFVKMRNEYAKIRVMELILNTSSKKITMLIWNF